MGFEREGQEDQELSPALKTALETPYKEEGYLHSEEWRTTQDRIIRSIKGIMGQLNDGSEISIDKSKALESAKHFLKEFPADHPNYSILEQALQDAIKVSGSETE